MSEMISLPTVDQGEFIHSRSDKWWLMPVTQAIIIIAFIFYSLWVVFIDVENSTVEGTNYVSPFYSPELPLENWPEFFVRFPALVLIWVPLGFRFTCYYARKVYHRAFLADPPACAVSELRKVDLKYKGENKLPFIVSNFHRYFFYLASILAIVHLIDFFRAMKFDDGIGFGFGTLLLGLDALFLALYVLSCHSCKHLVGGGLDCYSCNKGGDRRYKSWKIVKKLNKNHHAYFWLSLFTLVLADIYIRLLASGKISIIFDRW